MRHWWIDTDGKNEVLGDTPVPVSICPMHVHVEFVVDKLILKEVCLQVLHFSTHSGMLTNNCLHCGTAFHTRVNLLCVMSGAFDYLQTLYIIMKFEIPSFYKHHLRLLDENKFLFLYDLGLKQGVKYLFDILW